MNNTILLAAAVMLPVSAQAAVPSVDDIVASLRATECFAAQVRFEVSLPQSLDDVVYDLDISAEASPDDSLAPASYLIDWTYTNAPTGPSGGFSAYFTGHHYRYSPGRLQEYHMAWDSIPFRQGAQSVQRTARFVHLLPWAVADVIAAAQADPRYRLRVAPAGPDAVSLAMVMEIDAVECMSATYSFDSRSLRLLRSVSENNPGSIAEQTVTATYAYPVGTPRCQPLSEERLAGAYPEAFGRFRVSNFRIENLRGAPLPEIALPTSTRERYIHHRGETFRAPTLVVLLDPTAGFASATVAKVRDGVAGLPFAADVVWACSGTSVDAAEEAVGRIRPGEHLLVNAASLIRDCGAASLPVVIMVGQDGTVGDVILGYNKNLDSLVIQKMTLISK